MLQKASLASLQGISHLLELGDGCITEGQLSPAHSGRQLQATSCRRKVFIIQVKIYVRRLPKSRSPLMVFKEKPNAK